MLSASTWLQSLIRASRESCAEVSLVVSAPEQLHITASPTKHDRVLAVARDGKFRILDSSFRQMKEEEETARGMG